jgi:protein tyrosine phosphatase (PTP) superfamily phosphohydrolase (DUF442 family)
MMMRVIPSTFRASFGAFVAILLLSVVSLAQSADQQQAAFSNIKIKNFGQMDDRFYRGAQPKKEEDYQALKALGINTVIDLQEDCKDYEKPIVESLGMRYVNIPMGDKEYPKQEWVDAFLKVVNDPATGKFFVHCAGGRHRTGAMELRPGLRGDEEVRLLHFMGSRRLQDVCAGLLASDSGEGREQLIRHCRSGQPLRLTLNF